jgi:GTPase SAR1 family protein
MRVGVLAQVAALLEDALCCYAGTPQEEALRRGRRRLDEPLRVAIAGKVKAGKSTLLNALVGEGLAPTDEGECTRVVTWYRDSHTARVTRHGRDGSARPVPFRRDDGVLTVDLAGDSAADVDHLEVEWPSASLRTLTLIDTPGIDSLSPETSNRARVFLAPEDERETDADAVLYLMRHLHQNDVRFLEAFHDEEVSQASPINAIGVLSRADEIGVGRLDAMETAWRIATRYHQKSPGLRRLCQTVVPVAGLLAEGACGLRQDEFEAFRLLASLDPALFQRLLLSVDRFSSLDVPIPLGGDARQRLLLRFGVYGIRLGVELIRSGQVTNAPELAAELRSRSGLDRLRFVLTSQFASRRDILKARVGLTLLDAVLRESDHPERARLVTEMERIEAGGHEFAELRLLNALRTGVVDITDHEAAERLLGGTGISVEARLDLDRPDPLEARMAAAAELERWQRRAENPLDSGDARVAARVLVRTCERLVSELPGPTASPTP